MSKHVVVVLSEPVEGCEAEFDDWYENTHIPAVLETTGWTSGQRFKLTAEKGQKCPLQYLAFYEAEAESGDAVVARLDAHADAVPAHRLTFLFDPITYPAIFNFTGKFSTSSIARSLVLFTLISFA